MGNLAAKVLLAVLVAHAPARHEVLRMCQARLVAANEEEARPLIAFFTAAARDADLLRPHVSCFKVCVDLVSCRPNTWRSNPRSGPGMSSGGWRLPPPDKLKAFMALHVRMLQFGKAEKELSTMSHARLPYSSTTQES